MPTDQQPFPGYFDEDAARYAVNIVEFILDTIGKFV